MIPSIWKHWRLTAEKWKPTWGIDQYEAAALAGSYAVENIDGGKVALLEGVAGVDALDQRLCRVQRQD